MGINVPEKLGLGFFGPNNSLNYNRSTMYDFHDSADIFGQIL